jgi:myosin heavy subunit
MFAEYVPELNDSLVIFGKTKVFMRLPALEIIDTQYKKHVERKNTMAIKIQKCWRRFYQLKLFREFIKRVRRLQHIIRG